MVIKVAYFICGILIPYVAEEYAYRKYIYAGDRQVVDESPRVISQGYGWRVIWDAAYFFVLLGAAYQIIFSNSPLSNWEWLGYAGFIFGVGLRIWSLKELGRFYDPGIVIRTGHQMIRTGPYRFLRHPLHLGTLLKIIGLAAFSPLWLAIPTGFASLLLALNLNRTEDHNHARLLGLSFQEYYLSTWDIVDLFFSKKKLE